MSDEIISTRFSRPKKLEHCDFDMDAFFKKLKSQVKEAEEIENKVKAASQVNRFIPLPRYETSPPRNEEEWPF